VLTHRVHCREDVGPLLRELAAWDAGGGPVPGLHVGDLGWSLRDPDEVFSVHGWWDGEELLAVALCEGPLARPRVARRRLADREVAEAVADTVGSLEGEQVWSEAASGSALRAVFIERGWVDDDDPWAGLHVDLRSWDVPPVPAGEARSCLADRVEVQRAGFDTSTFTEEKWHRMAASSVYRPELDLVVRDEDGVAVATGTAWLGVAGGTAILEPISTHRDHRRAGHGTRLVHALASACRDQGAAGLNVWTPCRQVGAVPAYEAAGLSVFGTATDVRLDRRPRQD